MARFAKQKLSNPKRQIQGPLIQNEKKAPPVPEHNPININKAKPGATPPCSSYTLLKSTMENPPKKKAATLMSFQYLAIRNIQPLRWFQGPATATGQDSPFPGRESASYKRVVASSSA